MLLFLRDKLADPTNAYTMFKELGLEIRLTLRMFGSFDTIWFAVILTASFLVCW